MSAVWIIAQNTFREALRQKLVLTLALSSCAIVAGSLFFQQFNFGEGELKFVVDFGFGAMSFFGSILAIFATAQLYFSELDQRTVHCLLARPITRASFILGKFLGAVGVVWTFLALTGLTLLAVMSYRSAQLGAIAEAWIGTDVLVFGIVQALRALILVALVMLIGSYARSQLLTIIMVIFLWLIFQLQHIAAGIWENAESLSAQAATSLLKFGVPNFELFNVGEQLVFRDPGLLSLSVLAGLGGYAAAFTALYLALAVWSFGKREI